MDNPASPKQLAGRYEVRQVLGQGGMGLVYRAYDTVVRREVAVKTILTSPIRPRFSCSTRNATYWPP